MIPNPAGRRFDQALAAPVPAWLGRWMLPLLVGLAALSGLLSDAIGPSRHINLLAPPLLALMVWNLGVLLWLLTGRLRRSPGLTHVLALKLTRARSPARSAAELSAHTALTEARIGLALHLAAVAVAAGALAAMYLRGLGFEYRAGWDSTFLDAQAVHRWLAALLGPAAALSGIALPGPAQLEALRLSAGPGENAARWIHLYALTTLGLVILPRAALAAGLAWTVARLMRAAERGVERAAGLADAATKQAAPYRTAQSVAVLPYGYQISTARLPTVEAALRAHLGPISRCHHLDQVPLGGEDHLGPAWAEVTQMAPAPDLLVLLLALSATPERETHGAFVRAIQARCEARRPPLRCSVVLDESGFRARLAPADLPQRLSQRRAAWQQLLAETDLAPVFIDLPLQQAPGPVPPPPDPRAAR